MNDPNKSNASNGWRNVWAWEWEWERTKFMSIKYLRTGFITSLRLRNIKAIHLRGRKQSAYYDLRSNCSYRMCVCVCVLNVIWIADCHKYFRRKRNEVSPTENKYIHARIKYQCDGITGIVFGSCTYILRAAQWAWFHRGGRREPREWGTTHSHISPNTLQFIFSFFTEMWMAM